MTAARRLAAILAADVVGYSRLMGEDEAGTARAVRAARGARYSRRAHSEMPRRDSQVTMGGRLRVAAGLGSQDARRPPVSFLRR